MAEENMSEVTAKAVAEETKIAIQTMLFCQKKGDVASRTYTHYQHNKHTLHGNLW